MHIEDISYDFDGKEMIGHLAYDDAVSGRRPAVLLSHEGPGLDEHVKGRAERLASMGYVAFALDYHGGGVPVPFEEMMDRLAPLMSDMGLTRRLGLAGLDVLLAQDVTDPERVAAIGYCWGGAMSLEIARSGADVKAVVGFHPGLNVSPDTKNIKGSVLMCLGTNDPFVPLDQRLAWEKDMAEAAVADWNLELYGGVGHSFTNTAAGDLGMPGIAFDEKADKRSWESMLRLFGETINA
jgi:dienelactone hydrolase